MASGWFNRGKFEIFSQATNVKQSGSDIRSILLTDGYTLDVDDNIVNDLTPGSNEAAGGDRIAIPDNANRVVTEDDTLNLAKWDADDITHLTIDAAQTLKGVALYRHITDDTDSVLLFWCEFTSTVAGNGSDIDVAWHANGIARMT